MAGALRTNIVEICERIEKRLVDMIEDIGFTQIVWSARQEIPHLHGKADIVIRPRRGQQLQSFHQGGQRYAMVCVRVVDIIVRTSYAGAEAGNDKKWFEQHIRFEDDVLNALAGQILTDLADDVDERQDYLTCPILYMGTAEEQKDTNVKVSNLWGHSVHSFEVHFKPKLVLDQVT